MNIKEDLLYFIRCDAVYIYSRIKQYIIHLGIYKESTFGQCFKNGNMTGIQNSNLDIFVYYWGKLSKII